MSQTRFTPITSGLLARKGDAKPSAILSVSVSKPSPVWVRAVGNVPAQPPIGQPKRMVKSPGPPDDGKSHKMTVMLSAAEFERLGIAAVKKNVTRHQLVRAALALHLDKLKDEYGGCTCMTAGECSEDCSGA